MDADRFDTLAKRLVTPTTRRATLGAAAAGGLLSALGLGRAVPHAVPQTRAAQRRTCALAFVATVRLGPSVEQALTPNGTRPGELRGELRFSLSESGALEDSTLLLPDGTSLAVVGQAIGHSLQVRIDLGQRLALVAVGVGEQEGAACQGAIDGVVTGPETGDLGDWHAAVLRQTAGTGGAGADGNAPRTRAGRIEAPVDTTTGTDRSGRTNRSDPSDRSPSAAATPASGSTGSTAESGACAPDLTDCGGVCVDLTLDPTNCGACGEVCESGLVDVDCRNGVCERADCPVGTTDCGDVAGCRDLASDPQHCGACQQPCASGVCTGGVCPLCTAGLTDCGGVCADLSSDQDHCGSCEYGCIYGELCTGGVCQPQCAPGLSYCDNVCVGTYSDPYNCGGCGIACAADQVCEGGVCILPCASGLTRCFGFCVDTSSDPSNCGYCGSGCPFDFCENGACA